MIIKINPTPWKAGQQRSIRCFLSVFCSTPNNPENQSYHFQCLAEMVAVALILITLTSEVLAASNPALTITNLQPVTADVNLAGDYDPGVEGMEVRVLLEKIHNPHLLGQNVRLNVDFDLKNDEAEYIHLNSFNVWYPGSPVGPIDLSGNQTLAIPEANFTIPLANGGAPLPLKKRPVMTNGGFGVTGLALERKLFDGESLPFGRASDVLSYQTDDKRRYLTVGSREFMLGAAADATVDQIGLLRLPYIAKFSDSGFVSTSTQPSGFTELSALKDLENGKFLAAGRDYEYSDQFSNFVGNISLSRFLVYTSDKMGTTTDGASIDQEIDTFGDEGLATATFVDGANACEETEAVNIEVANMSTMYIVSADLKCNEQKRGGLAAFDLDGNPISTFGDNGVVVFAGPKGIQVEPVGAYEAMAVSIRGKFKVQRFLYIGAAVGDGCSGSINDCNFGLTRFDLLTGEHDANFGWKLVNMPRATASRPFDMVKDGLSRFVFGGVGIYGKTRRLAMARFEVSGQLDATFSGDGLVVHQFQNQDADIYALTTLPGNELAAAVFSREELDGQIFGSFGVARFDATGGFQWEHSPFHEDWWTLNDVESSLNYGYRRATRVSSAPHAITVDSLDRIVLAGLALSPSYEDGNETVYLANPPTAPDPITGLPEPIGSPGSQMIALARYLPFGVLDDRRWIRPNEIRKFIVPEDRDLADSNQTPFEIFINLNFDGFNTFSIFRLLEEHSNEVLQFGIAGAYPFPMAPFTLNFGEAFYIKSHSLDHHHRNSAGNRFAYDISVKRWNGSDWTTQVEDPSAENLNQNHLIWGRQIRAVAAGNVVACRRNSPDNPVGEIIDSANYLKIQHALSPGQIADEEYVSYLHLQENTIPEAICPEECPDDDQGCFDPIPVNAGDYLGLAGNSGNSTGPHLHIHVTTGVSSAGSYPLNFRDVLIGAPTNFMGIPQQPKPWWEVDGRSIPHGTLLIPQQ